MLPGRRIARSSVLLALALGASGVLQACRYEPRLDEATLLQEAPSPAWILQEIRTFGVLATALHVGAHPDDENTQLIAYLARSRGYRTAYLSVTRGDGGQNVLGPQLGDKLGVARTQELLAARRIDSGRQYFTRALDFGFSKDYAETLAVWDRQEVLGDVVRVIRTFRPDVIVTRFSTVPGGTHGHHTASAVLAVEAFRLAGDPSAYPEQLGTLEPWQPKRILLSAGGGGGRGGAPPSEVPGSVSIDIGGDDPVLGFSFASIAGMSRGMHRTQNFGPGGPGEPGGPPRVESLQPLDGDPATADLMDGVDTSWNRVPGGAEVARRVAEVIDRFDPTDVAASVPALLEVRALVQAFPSSPLVDDRRLQLDQIIVATLGIRLSTLVSEAEVVPGETLHLQHTVTVEASLPVRWLGVRYPAVGGGTEQEVTLRPGRPASVRSEQTVPESWPVSQPYWLREPGTPGMFRVDDASLIGLPENPPVFPVEWLFEVGGQTLSIPDEPLQVTAAGTPRRLDLIAPVSLRFLSEVVLFAPNGERQVTVEVRAHRGGTAGTVRLDAPPGWRVTPQTQSFDLAAIDARASFTFAVAAPSGEGEASIAAVANVGGTRYDNQFVEIRYDHLPVQILQPRATLKGVAVAVETRGTEVGYVAGAGDQIPEALERLGYRVTRLESGDLTPERLAPLDAVVIGIRAYNVRQDLPAMTAALFRYVEGGGTVVAQYNVASDLPADLIAPFPLQISGDRVTDERAAMTFLAPDHPVLNTPNRITAADFEGWVQERGLYYAGSWDDRFTPILSANDPGEASLRGGLLVARHGQGTFVYTSLAFFRQLPAGVPGAYRLFANLVSVGKDGPP